ncbi:glycosyltransferase family 1 protein [bacterium]|nr:MAG: glycosyltransferase family 1 protein [bacterium]
MKHPKFSHAFEVTVDLPAALQPLKKLAGNFRWTWDHDARELFASIDKEAWDRTEHNPVAFVNGFSKERLSRLAKDTYFLDRLNDAATDLDRYLGAETWFDRTYPGGREKTKIAYFCFEFGISEGLPIYSGGLGILAGDHVKAASDLGIPLVGIGLLYNRGYFRQRLTHDGWQQEVYPTYDFYQMPLTLARDAEGKPIRIEVEFPDRVVTCQIWKAEVGRIPLYLLDSNVLENQPWDQGITDALYGGDEDMRIRQEMILGIGGMRALQALGIQPTVCHLNEGHAAFSSLERIRQFMKASGADFRTARQATVGANVFTTHTPVPAGFDLFPPQMLERYLGRMSGELGLPFNEFIGLGRNDPQNSGEAFNMALLAMSTSNHVNGVAKLHGAVSREMFANRWPNVPEDEVPIDSVTNGIHTATWTSRRMAELFDRYLGSAWRERPEEEASWAGVEEIPDDELWHELDLQRADLVRFARQRLRGDLERKGAGRVEPSELTSILDPNILTIGFARRFATYKRGSLMLTDRDRLKSILYHPERPVQILIAGKAHPRDEAGKKIIQDLANFMGEFARNRMVFLEDYDMRVARRLVQGVDLWLNNPRRPYEASGTSGMKVVPNGGLNCSILDGWWDEGFDPSLGWAIGGRQDVGDSGHQDWLDSRAFYHLLETQIAPTFYHRVDSGVPRDWIRMVKRSIMAHAPQFSTSRMVAEYTQRFYMPASASYEKMAASGLEPAKETLAWRDRVIAGWSSVRVIKAKDDAGRASSLGRTFKLTARVALGALKPEDVRVEALVGKAGSNRELLGTRVEALSPAGTEGDVSIFEGEVVCDVAGHQGYTVRVVPSHPNVDVPAELQLVAWE